MLHLHWHVITHAASPLASDHACCISIRRVPLLNLRVLHLNKSRLILARVFACHGCFACTVVCITLWSSPMHKEWPSSQSFYFVCLGLLLCPRSLIGDYFRCNHYHQSPCAGLTDVRPEHDAASITSLQSLPMRSASFLLSSSLHFSWIDLLTMPVYVHSNFTAHTLTNVDPLFSDQEPEEVLQLLQSDFATSSFLALPVLLSASV